MLSHLDRMQARMLLGSQAEMISWWLDQEDHGLTPDKEKNWRQLLDTLSKVHLCFHDMEEDMTRTKNDLGDYRLRVLEDAQSIGQMRAQIDMLQKENNRIKGSLDQAIKLLDSHQINQTTLWHN